jgi:hypothetical protein
MAKKHKKFKKKISQNLNQRIAQIQSDEKPVADTPGVSVSVSPVAAVNPEIKETDPIDNKYTYVKKDIRRDFMIIVLLLLILAGATILNAKTEYLKDFSHWIYTILNLKV